MSTHHLAHGSLVLRQPSTTQMNGDNYYTQLKISDIDNNC